MPATRIKVLECGRTSLDYELAVSGHPDEILTRGKEDAARRWLHHPVYAYVIEHPDGHILVDTGVAADFEARWRHPFYPLAMRFGPGAHGTFEELLKAHGYGVEDFRFVVLTHLHTDHAGNAPLFASSNASIIVHEDELRGAVTTKGALLRDDDISLWGVTSVQGFTRQDFGFLVPERATTVYADIEIAGGVWVVSLPGHTWGSIGVAVWLDSGNSVLLASDAIYLAASYRRPFVGSILNQDPESWARSALKVRKLAEKHDMLIIPGHDDSVIAHPKDSSGVQQPIDASYQ